MAQINWKHEYLGLSDQMKSFRHRYPPVGRVTDLLHGYMEVVESLLYAEVNGGLDECYEDFPHPPTPTGEKRAEVSAEHPHDPETPGSQ